MRQDVLRNAEKYTKVHKRQRLRHRVVTVLAGVVVFCTTYALCADSAGYHTGKAM